MTREEQSYLLRKLQKHSARLGGMIDDGSFEQLPARKQRKLVRHTRRLYDHLVGFMPRSALRLVMAASVAAVLGLGCGGGGVGPQQDASTHQLDAVAWQDAAPNDAAVQNDAGTAPTFGPPVNNPHGISSTAQSPHPVLGDIDGDGDLDLFLGSGDYYSGDYILFHENTGSATSPAFAAEVPNPFGIVTITPYDAYPALADIDDDGDLDLLVGEYSGTMQLFLNVGTPTSPAFAAPVENASGLSSTLYVAAPTFADIDGDGDLDLFVGEYGYNANQGLQYFENVGTPTAASFAAPVPVILSTLNYMASPFLADIDGDGDLDLFLGTGYDYDGSKDSLFFYENTGTATAAAWANGAGIHTPIPPLGYAYMTFPTLADIDGDGDLDLVLGAVPAQGVFFFENPQN